MEREDIEMMKDMFGEKQILAVTHNMMTMQAFIDASEACEKIYIGKVDSEFRQKKEECVHKMHYVV